MKILITSGAGFIGSRLAKKLVEKNHSVKVFDNLLPQVHDENLIFDLPEYKLTLSGDRNFKVVRFDEQRLYRREISVGGGKIANNKLK